ncbi:4Fe-4S cluster-binding domain-containing protein [Orbus sasakiae]|uniref:4Fe-4S cluster-binding domain-containing protein n=1 Tax=Orbus sasakiae TaxID=1078475 RepID=A0ABP9N468_9GAMM
MEMGLSRVHFPVTTLGPGQRLGIWFQGCHLQCQGCISTDTWPKAKHLTDIDALLDVIKDWIHLAEGITISGGEPFEQPQALAYLVHQLKRLTPVDILIYTGLPFAKIVNDVNVMAPNVDVIISEPFVINEAQTFTLRGSDNQNMHLLTPLGQARFADYQYQRMDDQHHALDMMFDEKGVIWFAGIPKRDDFLTLQTLLENQGHQLKTTAHKTKQHKRR